MKTSYKFLVLGALFGLCFPFIATLLELFYPVSRPVGNTILDIHTTDPLIMIIDTAPFFLGFFAYLIGQRQERNENINKELMSSLEELHKMQNQLLEQERLRSEIALSSQIAHELKNPLNFIINYTEISMELLRECAIPEGSGPMYEDLNGIKKNISDNLMVIHKHGKRSGSILSELLKAQHAAA